MLSGFVSTWLKNGVMLGCLVSHWLQFCGSSMVLGDVDSAGDGTLEMCCIVELGDGALKIEFIVGFDGGIGCIVEF